MSEKNLTAIVCSGGGMRSAHGAGFLHALATELNITSPNIMIGSSGDAGNILYFSTGQYEDMKRIWTELLSTSKFISLFRLWRMMDIDYLVDIIFKKEEPLDMEKLRTSTIQWSIPINDFDTGVTRYADRTDKLDLFEILRATTALPVIFGKRISLDGRRYIDGEIGTTLQDHVDHALSLGATKILVLNHTTPAGFFFRTLLKRYAAWLPQGMRDAILRDVSTNCFEVSAPNAKVIVVAPQKLAAGNFTRDKRKLQKTFDQGVENARSLREELSELFSA